ncbi:hypothetical protein CR513_10851, partial [Mucuna pruriens]
MVRPRVELRTIINASNFTIENKLLCKAQELMSLPYCILVTNILKHHRIDGDDEGEITPCWYNKFNVYTLIRMNIKHINRD